MILKHETFKDGDDLSVDVIIAIKSGIVVHVQSVERQTNPPHTELTVWYGGYEAQSLDHDHAE